MRLIAYSITLAVLLLTVFALVGRAQTPTVTVPVNTPLTVEWESEHALALVSFRALVDGAIVKNFVAADLTMTPQSDLTKCAAPGVTPPPTSCTTYRAAIPGVARGAHVLLIRAFNELGQADSAPLNFVAGVVPRAPSLPRISVTATAGGLTIEVKDDRASTVARLVVP